MISFCPASSWSHFTLSWLFVVVVFVIVAVIWSCCCCFFSKLSLVLRQNRFCFVCHLAPGGFTGYRCCYCFYFYYFTLLCFPSSQNFTRWGDLPWILSGFSHNIFVLKSRVFEPIVPWHYPIASKHFHWISKAWGLVFLRAFTIKSLLINI